MRMRDLLFYLLLGFIAGATTTVVVLDQLLQHAQPICPDCSEDYDEGRWLT